jgi:hypothetical protein
MPDKAKSQPWGRLPSLKPLQSSDDIMKNTSERSDLQALYAEQRIGLGSSNNEIIFKAVVTYGSTRLGSCSGRRDGQCEAHHANGQLIGIFPDLPTASRAVVASWRWTHLSVGDTFVVGLTFE